MSKSIDFEGVNIAVVVITTLLAVINGLLYFLISGFKKAIERQWGKIDDLVKDSSDIKERMAKVEVRCKTRREAESD